MSTTPPRPSRSSSSEATYTLELGSGPLLALLCGIGMLCGLFFAIGYTFGKHTVPASLSLAGPTAQNTGATGSNGSKTSPSTPLPVSTSAQPPNPSGLTEAENNNMPQGLQAAPGASSTAAPQGAQAPGTAAAPGAPVAGGPAPKVIQVSHPVVSQSPVPPGEYAVQVFAGASRGDALNLAAALKDRQYPVFVVEPQAGQGPQFYRVQVGPFKTQEAAKSMMQRLTSDGYNAILKH